MGLLEKQMGPIYRMESQGPHLVILNSSKNKPIKLQTIANKMGPNGAQQYLLCDVISGYPLPVHLHCFQVVGRSQLFVAQKTVIFHMVGSSEKFRFLSQGSFIMTSQKDGPCLTPTVLSWWCLAVLDHTCIMFNHSNMLHLTLV